MAAPSELPNSTKVRKAAISLIQAISQSHPTDSYYTDGIVCALGKDPRIIVQDHVEDYRRLGAAAGIFTGTEEVNPRRTGGVRRYVHTYPILCMRTLTPAQDAAGITLDQLIDEMVWDLKEALDPDQRIKAAWTALGLSGGISCIDHHVIAVIGDEGINFPDAHFVVQCSFEYDRRVRQ